jgi:hypothetical protein
VQQSSWERNCMERDFLLIPWRQWFPEQVHNWLYFMKCFAGCVMSSHVLCTFSIWWHLLFSLRDFCASADIKIYGPLWMSSRSSWSFILLQRDDQWWLVCRNICWF